MDTFPLLNFVCCFVDGEKYAKPKGKSAREKGH